MIDTEALRKKVIDLAIRGKLTKQLPEDGTAEELYAQIQEEKARLVQEGKTKKPKPLPEIAADEIPFEIPRNWKWVHLNAIATSSLGKTLNKSTDKGDICKYLCSINVQWNKINLDTVKTARFENDEKEKYRLRKGDLLICEGGDSGRSAIWDSDEEMYYQNALHRVRFVGGISPWLYCYIMEYYKKSGIISFYTKGIGIQHLVQSALNAIWLPLPPLDEQIRIVDKVRTAFQQIDIIDAFQSQYCNNLESLKSKIIDAGIRGKLTEQLPTDGTAEELYAQIQEEKARLIKEKKIKKEKPLPAIEADEIPFEIPKNWKWVRLGDICPGIKTGSLDANQKDDNGRYPFFTCGEDVYFTMNYAFDCDAILLGGNNASGDYKMHRYCGKFNAYQRVYVITGLIICLDYIFWIIKYWLPHLKVNSQGMTTRFIKIGQVTNMLTPLPPLTEQKRIAQKIDKILRVI